MIDCYVGMGGNQAYTLETFRLAAARLQESQNIFSLQASRLYDTTPVSPIPQPHYLNAVLKFYTSLSSTDLWNWLQQIEFSLGKLPKAKAAPRLIDLDLLFYGDLIHNTVNLSIPHPSWHERLFVLKPLSDVTNRVPTTKESMQEILKNFSNPHKEEVVLLEEDLFKDEAS